MFRKLAAIVCIVSILTLQVNVFEAHATGWLLPSITTTGITAGEAVPILSGAASTYNPYIIGAAVAGVAILAGYAWYTSRGTPTQGSTTVDAPQNVNWVDLSTLDPTIKSAPVSSSMPKDSLKAKAQSGSTQYTSLAPAITAATGTQYTSTYGDMQTPASTVSATYHTTQLVQRLDTPSNTKASAYNMALAKQAEWRSLPYADTTYSITYATGLYPADMKWFPVGMTQTQAQATFCAYIVQQRTSVPGVGYVTHYQCYVADISPTTVTYSTSVTNWDSVNFNDDGVSRDAQLIFVNSSRDGSATVKDSGGTTQTTQAILQNIVQGNLDGSAATFAGAQSALTANPGDPTAQTNYNKALNNYNTARVMAGLDPTVAGPGTATVPSGTTSTGSGFTDFAYTPSGQSSTAYGASAPVGDFGALFSQFASDLQGTSLFGSVSSFFGAVPSGGSSTISFSGGRFGTHTYDFADWGAVLNTLRAVLLVSFSAVGIRVVALKGGAA